MKHLRNVNIHHDSQANSLNNQVNAKAFTYTTMMRQLAFQRVMRIRRELVEKGISPRRFITFDNECEKIDEGIHNCSDQVSEKKSNFLDQNVEVKILLK